MEVSWETHNLVGNVAGYDFVDFFTEKLKEIKNKSTEPEVAIKEHLISEIEYELNKMKKELDYEEADFFARSGDSGEEE
jgi:hypothetical protein